MKRIFSKMTLFAVSLLICFGFYACGGDDGPSKSSGNDGQATEQQDAADKEDELTNRKMTSVEQKEYLEKTALEFMALNPSSDLQSIGALAKHIKTTIVEDYDWDNVEDWAEDVMKAAKVALGTGHTESDSSSYDFYDYNKGQYVTYVYNYQYIYTDYKYLLMASNFKGHFTARDGQWVKSDANDLQFIFNDQNGKTCNISLTTSENTKNVHILTDESRDGSDYNQNGEYEYLYKYFYNNNNYTLAIPENVTVTLTQDGTQVVKTTVNVDIKSLQGEEFDISKNSLNVSALVELNNGYKVNISQVAYNANNSCSVQTDVSKNGKTLTSVVVTSDLSGAPSATAAGLIDDPEDYDWDSANGKNVYAKIDIIGKVQIMGTLSDVRKFADYIQKAKDNKYSEANFKSYMNQANDLANLNIYYNGTDVKQAQVKFEAFEDESYNGNKKWEMEPVMYFDDGSSYSTFEAFFNHADFKKTIDTFKSLANSYADLIGEEIDW